MTEITTFHNQLEATLESIHGSEILLLMGDLNANVGSENVNYKRLIRKEGCRVQNDNGERLIGWFVLDNVINGVTRRA